MRTVESIQFNDKELVVKELTCAELDHLLSENRQMTIVDRLFDEEVVTESMITTATGLTHDDLVKFGPSKLRPLIDAVKEINSDFFRMARAEVKRAEKLKEAALKKISGRASAS